MTKKEDIIEKIEKKIEKLGKELVENAHNFDANNSFEENECISMIIENLKDNIRELKKDIEIYNHFPEEFKKSEEKHLFEKYNDYYFKDHIKTTLNGFFSLTLSGKEFDELIFEKISSGEKCIIKANFLTFDINKNK